MMHKKTRMSQFSLPQHKETIDMAEDPSTGVRALYIEWFESNSLHETLRQNHKSTLTNIAKKHHSPPESHHFSHKGT